MAMKPNTSAVLVFDLLLFEILAIATISISFCNGSSYHVGCLGSEKEALLSFKRDLKDPSNRLASWSGNGDCCAWAGVFCDNITGHVLHLDLRNPFNYHKESEYEAIRRTALVGMVTACSFTRSVQQYLPLPIDVGVILVEKASVVSKGEMVDYEDILNLVRMIDISRNNFSGKIPLEVTNLKALQSLNFSYNSFTGRIPESIGVMRSLESIDFSANQLSGEIPESMSSLTFLNHLNLSNNNLTGKIPSSTQLQSFDVSSFAGNDLCGAPLPKNCTENVSISEDENGDEDEDEVDHWLYVSAALGFVVGFWCFMGPLLVRRRWRYKYYHSLNRLGDRFVGAIRKCC
ncbi:receptor-like protein 50 isoform X3 [Citrus sinensis]|uniref:receptor-like protein 50 isoform X3 n=1 Tax=Citrus sinensis TaxID=2711 RepID=UPI0022799750|nr:receptor-like protein 50 isoform X3 [Citrus sinensis]